MLKINNLCVEAENKEILKGLDLVVNENETHIIMGKNGIGKSTLCKVILNDPSYNVTSGNIEFLGEDITNKQTSDIAKMGVFLLEQNPTEIPGVTNLEMLRQASIARGEKTSVFEFNKMLNEACAKLGIDKSFINRNINERMSGGEKKKNELLGLLILKPKLILLDELDSGLDVDSLKALAEAINEYKKESKCSIIIITHHTNILSYIKPDKVHILENGIITITGEKSLADSIEENGFGGTFNVSEDTTNE